MRIIKCASQTLQEIQRGKKTYLQLLWIKRRKLFILLTIGHKSVQVNWIAEASSKIHVYCCGAFPKQKLSKAGTWQFGILRSMSNVFLLLL